MTYTGSLIPDLRDTVDRVLGQNGYLGMCSNEECESLARTQRDGKPLCRNCADDFDQNLSPDYEPNPPEGHYR